MSKMVPSCILLFSGKRKSGKDFLTDKIVESFQQCEKLVTIKISAPIKSHFALTRNLNLDDLMGSGKYKEIYREEMIKWSEEERLKNPGIFCSQAVDMYQAKEKAVWIVSDVRRKTDIAWFKNEYGNIVKTVRVEADHGAREERGWRFTAGVDDVPSECDLDNLTDWNWIIYNNGKNDPSDKLMDILKLIKEALVEES